MSTDTPKLSANETLKENSNYLMGTIDVELAEPTDHFNKDNIQLLKFHGTYEQDDRDARGAAKKEGGGKAYSMMVRNRIPGGRMTSEQLLAELAMRHAGEFDAQDHYASNAPTPRDPEGQSACDNQTHQRYPLVDASGMRRCQSKHHVLSR